MIINIRGTSGSGKSHLARRIMDLYPSRTKVRVEGRRQPIGYICHREDGKDLAVLGHYETACGGCDTISKMEEIFELVRTSHLADMDVLFEGLLISADVNRTAALHEEGLPLRVVALDLPLEVCLESVNSRRMERLGPEKFTPVNPKNTESKHKGVRRSCERLLAQDIDVIVSSDRETAFDVVKRSLDL